MKGKGRYGMGGMEGLTEGKWKCEEKDGRETGDMRNGWHAKEGNEMEKKKGQEGKGREERARVGKGTKRQMNGRNVTWNRKGDEG